MKNKIIKASLLMIFTGLIIFVIYNLVRNEVKVISKTAETNKSLVAGTGQFTQSTSASTLVSGYDQYKYNGYKVFAEKKGPIYNEYYPVGADFMPKISYGSGDYLFYCVHHQGTLKYGSGVTIIPMYTQIRYVPPSIAYIVTQNGNTWSGSDSSESAKSDSSKANAIWFLANDLNSKYVKDEFGGQILDEGSALPKEGEYAIGDEQFYYEAKAYQDYDEVVRNKGLQPKFTNTDITVTTRGDELVVGSFNLDYVLGQYQNPWGTIFFSGISGIKLVGYDSEGNEVTDRAINVKTLILGSSQEEKKPKYFGMNSSINKTYVLTDYDCLEWNNTHSDKKDKYRTYTESNGKVRALPNFPRPKENFKIVIDNPNKGLKANQKRVVSISVKVEFNYMLANGKYMKFKVVMGNTSLNKNAQSLMSVDGIRSLYKQQIETDLINIISELGGHVWEDIPATKETKADGRSNTSGNVDKSLKNIEVILHKADGSIAKVGEDLLLDPNETGISEEELMHRINPTYTDDGGNYLFKGLNPANKYYVEFRYNGQTYMPTEYLNTSKGQYKSVTKMLKSVAYNSDDWKYTSKGTETPTDRNKFDSRFEEIGSSPNNYKRINLFTDTREYSIITDYLNNSNNKTFTIKELMGYTLDADGNYKQTGTQLIDGYLYDEKGLETTTYKEGVITTEVRNFIKTNKHFPTNAEMKAIYNQIAGVNTPTESLEVLKQEKATLQQERSKAATEASRYRRLIEQLENQIAIESSLPNPDEGDLADWEIQLENSRKGLEEENRKIADFDKQIAEIDKKIQQANNTTTTDPEIFSKLQYIEDCKMFAYTGNPFAGQQDRYPVKGTTEYYVNLGLWRRQETDMALRKDVYKAAVKINSKTGVYKYNKRELKDGTWEVSARLSDMTYYNSKYDREIYKADYYFKTKTSEGQETANHLGNPLEVYVTYKLTVRNQSQSIESEIREVVDYYDKNYEYVKNLSWVNYESDALTDEEYYNAIQSGQLSAIKSARNVNSTTTSAYGSVTHSDITKLDQYGGVVYVKGLQGKKLQTGETAYIYLTFKVKKENDGTISLGSKKNLAEINGYKAYYKDGTKMPNGVRVEKGKITQDGAATAWNSVWQQRSIAYAGLIDRDSKPGNLEKADLSGDKYQKNFEDDTDEATPIDIKLKEGSREVNGVVWEDNRDQIIEGASIGNGIRDNNEKGIDKVTVQLVEKTTNGKEYIWEETTTANGGKYTFNEYIPGQYILRFYYGNSKDAIALQDGASYNGHDFKSTIYNSNAASNANVSDAIDIWETPADASSNRLYRKFKDNRKTIDETRKPQGRNTVVDYSDGEVTNYLAEILASPYSGNTNNVSDEFINNTYMTAETGTVQAEVEYNKKISEGTAPENYVIPNVDLGLVERAKAQLEINKSVSNIKVTLANQSVLFDVNKKGDNVIWQPAEEYKLNEKADKNGTLGAYRKLQEAGKYENYYGKDGKHRYSYRTEIDKIVSGKDSGIIQLTMDEELMHGATIQITYKVKVTNVGETDYDGKDFYYTGKKSGKTVTTTANQVVDYVANNLKFDGENQVNKDKWKIIKAEDLVKTDAKTTLVNKSLENQVKTYNTVITSTERNELNKVLKPGEFAETSLVLTQLITPQNKSDNLSYSNMVEIVKTTNSVGRRMAFSIVGNQDPTAAPTEVDSSIAERVVILPPFGEVHIYYILGIAVSLILIGGIAFIIKRVMKK